jgi:LysM repeat protein
MQNLATSRKFSRRQVIGGALGLSLGGGALLRSAPTPAKAAVEGNHHLVWVWQFSTDAEPNSIALRLLKHDMGIIMKTHDGVEWMSEYDTSRYAVSGYPQVQVLSQYFEGAGVPFHAWAVLHGTEPVEEARLAAAVLLSGARSIFLDVEPHAGFWRGTPAAATAFCQELRRLVPEGNVVLSIDARPWLKNEIPLAQFLPYINALAPQHYWKTFDTQANYEKYAQAGHQVPDGGITPEFLLATTKAVYADTNLPLHHTGQGATTDPADWVRFTNAAYALDADFLSVWRYGVTEEPVLETLGQYPPKQPPAGVIAGPSVIHVVEAGQTVGFIAGQYGTTVDAIVKANNLTDANYVYIGQELKIPGSVPALNFPASTTSTGGASAPAPSASQASTSSGTTYVVQAGDTLSGIAARYGTSVSAIAAANNISDPSYIYIGQHLSIP